MAELKLFKVNGKVEELKSKSVTIEKEGSVTTNG